MKIKITEDTSIRNQVTGYGEPVFRGDVIDTYEQAARELIYYGLAVPADREAEATGELVGAGAGGKKKR